MDIIKALVNGGLWPLALFFGAVSVTTVIALLRADRKDIPLVFRSFAEAFGIHPRPAVTDANATDVHEQTPGSNRDGEPTASEGGENVGGSTEPSEIQSSTSENGDDGA
ncbi:hypothetical protein [Nocardia sp. NPDC051832]|uniref:hypothetical protein n=1 Tax=Nocardia sp. NPDC051832 TaxID=3155673 RepID=UPI003416C7E4